MIQRPLPGNADWHSVMGESKPRFDFKANSSEKKSNRQNYKCRVVYLKTSNFRTWFIIVTSVREEKNFEVYVIERAEYQLLRYAA